MGKSKGFCTKNPYFNTFLIECTIDNTLYTGYSKEHRQAAVSYKEAVPIFSCFGNSNSRSNIQKSGTNSSGFRKISQMHSKKQSIFMKEKPLPAEKMFVIVKADSFFI